MVGNEWEAATDPFAFIAEHSMDVIVRTGADGLIRYISPAIRRYGLEPAELIGTPATGLVHPEDAERLAGDARKLLAGEVDPHYRREHRFGAEATGWTWFEGNPTPVLDAHGQVVEVVNIFRDISQRRAAEDIAHAQAELFEAAFENVAAGMMMVDGEAVIVRANPAFCRILGYRADEVVGKSILGLLHPDDVGRAQRDAHKVFLGELKYYDAEDRYRRKDGAYAPIHVTATLVRSAGGEFQYTVAQLHDLTERRAAEAALHETEAKLREQAELFERAFRYAAIGKALVGLDGSFLKINEAYCRILGYSEVEMLEMDFQLITHPDDLEADIRQLEQLTAGEIDTYQMDKRYVRSDGEVVWVRLSVSMVRSADGSPKHYIAQVQDQTEQRAAEAALRESEARLRLITDRMTDVVVQMEPDSTVTYVSPSARYYGFEPEDLLGLQADLFVHPEDVARVRANRALVEAGDPEAAHADHQARYVHADGSWIWMEGNPQVVCDEAGNSVGTINVLRNVTERRAQADLFETAFQEAAIGKALVELDNRVVKVNRTLCAMLGYSEAEMLQLNGDRLIHPEELGKGNAEIARLALGELDSYSAERRFLKADGAYLWCGMTIAMVRHPDGSPKNYVVELQDLTERRAAEAALREIEARYRMITENTSDMIIMTDLTGKALYVSPNVRVAGVEATKVEGHSFADYTHPDDIKPVREAFMQLLKEGGATRVRWRSKNQTTGAWTWLESNPSLVRDPETGEPTGFLDVIRDIDGQVAQEAAIAAAQAEAEAAAAAKSQFLANMSHEIRTPLTAVLGFTNLLREMPLPATAEGYVGRIAGAGNALLAIVNDILDFSKLEAGKFEIRPKATDVGLVCEETLQLFSTQAATKGLSLSFHAGEGLPRAAMLDGDRLRQMLINLVGNAVKFSDEGGVTLSVAPAAKAGWVRIEVADTGPGLDDEAQALLFQRFTQIDGSMTRRHGGTGLGLAISRGIAEAMGGEIGVQSTAGEGATFFVELPAPPAELAAELAGDEAFVSPIEGTRVFVVDDNPVNRELSRRILEAAGAEVHEASDGAEAVERLGLLPVDVVLMDLRMPVLDGRAALKQLRGTGGPNQDVPVLAFTADADLEGEGDLDGFDGLVRKPIQPAEMYRAIAGATQWVEPQDEDQAYVVG